MKSYIIRILLAYILKFKQNFMDCIIWLVCPKLMLKKNETWVPQILLKLSLCLIAYSPVFKESKKNIS